MQEGDGYEANTKGWRYGGEVWGDIIQIVWKGVGRICVGSYNR